MHVIGMYPHLVICTGGDDINASTTIDHNASYAYIIDKYGDEKSGVRDVRLEGSDLSI